MNICKYIITLVCTLSWTGVSAQDNQVQCEDTCSHVHGIDLSHYQGEVFWEAIGDNSKMAYVYLKATEGGDRIDDKNERNIELAHKYGLKVGSYHFFRPKTPLKLQLENFMAQCRPSQQDLIPMIDVETKQGLSNDAFRDSLMTFLTMVEKAYHQKPLVYTARVKRLLGTSAVLYVLALIPGLILPYGMAIFGVVLLCTPLVVLLANFINTPVEKMVARYYVEDARRKLQSMPDLTVIGVTGSFGKTSTKYFLNTLLSTKYHVLMTPGNYNTTLGVVRTVREMLSPTHQIFLCEMGARHKGDI